MISASGAHAIAAALFGSNYIVNTGHIAGAIILGSGNDFFDGRDGTWSRGGADIRLREGDDVFYGGNSHEFVFADEGNDTVDGGDGDDRLMGRRGDDFLRGGSGNDEIWGESGVDAAAYSGSFADYTISRQADGSFIVTDNRFGIPGATDGADTLVGIEYLQFADRTIALTMQTNSAPTSVALSATSVGGNAPVGTVVGTLSGIDPDGDPLGYHLVTNPGSHFRIHGNQLLVDRAFTGETRLEIVVRASDPDGASIDRTFTIDVTTGSVSSGVSALTLKGSKTADVLAGGRGNDRLDGGLGNDKLTGGAGRDTFAFSSKLGPANVDRIVDFRNTDDTIKLSKAIFGKLQKGGLSKDAFWVGAKAHDQSDRIIFNKKTGALYYDADGSGTKHEAIKFAQLKSKTLVAADDFFVV